MGLKSNRNKTLSCSQEEISEYSRHFLQVRRKISVSDIENRLIEGDFFESIALLPNDFVDLLILDPPYNLTKNYNGRVFNRTPKKKYADWFEKVISLLLPTLKSDCSIYVCSDWRTSTIIYPILEDKFLVQNRITWEREKGRGAQRNWKNNTEDIWFCSRSEEYTFNLDSVKLKKRVIAPYKENGNPKDWQEENGENYRLTCPSNLWTDITIPFWSMPENTPHPTQKPEKLIAKLILASSKEGGFVFDPFLGSGTSAVVSEKLNRRWCGIDINKEYLCLAHKRILSAQKDPTIQGYKNGVFWERNSFSNSKRSSILKNSTKQSSLF